MKNTAKKVNEMEEKLKTVKRNRVCDKKTLHKASESKSGKESMQSDTGWCPIGSGYFKNINLILNGSWTAAEMKRWSRSGRIKQRGKKTESSKDKHYPMEMRSQKETTSTEAMKTDPKPCASYSVLIHNIKGDMD